MKSKQTTVKAYDGRLAMAQAMCCENCECDIWHVFIIDGHDHPHVQCFDCGASYCPSGNCGGAQP